MHRFAKLRDGRIARIFTTSATGTYPIVGEVPPQHGEAPGIFTWTAKGMIFERGDGDDPHMVASRWDIVALYQDEPEHRNVAVELYQGSNGGLKVRLAEGDGGAPIRGLDPLLACEDVTFTVATSAMKVIDDE